MSRSEPRSLRDLLEASKLKAAERVVGAQYRLDLERQLTLDGREEPLSDPVYSSAELEPASSPATNRNQLELGLRVRKEGRRSVPYFDASEGQLGLFVPEHRRRDALRHVVEQDTAAIVPTGWGQRNRSELRRLARDIPGLNGSWVAMAMGMIAAIFDGLTGQRKLLDGARIGTELQIPEKEWVRMLGCHRSSIRRAVHRLDPTLSAADRVFKVRCGRRGPNYARKLQEAGKRRPSELGPRYARHRRLAKRIHKLTDGRVKFWTCGQCHRCRRSHGHRFLDIVPVFGLVGDAAAVFLQPGPAALELLCRVAPPKGARRRQRGPGEYLRIRRRLRLAQASNTNATPSPGNLAINHPINRTTASKRALEGGVGPDPPPPSSPHPENGQGKRKWSGKRCDLCGTGVARWQTWCRPCLAEIKESNRMTYELGRELAREARRKL